MQEKAQTGYPSIDKPWLKYYSEEAIRQQIPQLSLYEYLWMCNKNHLDDIALLYYDKKMSYRKLFLEIDKAAAAYHEIGVKKTEIVTIVALSSPEIVISLYALNKVGAIVNVVNAMASKKELKDYLNEASSKVLICWEPFYENVKDLLKETQVEKVILINPLYYASFNKKCIGRIRTHRQNIKNVLVIKWAQFLRKRQFKDICEEFIPNSACIIAHTGGTTGVPKGVLISNEAVNTVAMQYAMICKHKRQEIYMDLIVPFVIYGIAVNMHMPLCMGLKTVLVPYFKTEDIPKFFIHYKPNIVISIPSYWMPLLKDKNAQKRDFSNIRLAAAGGDGLTTDVQKKVTAFLEEHNSNAKLLNGYGMTELCSVAISNFDFAMKPGSIGIPMPKVIVKIVNPETLEEMKYGESGEICVRSSCEMLGYYKNKIATDDLIRIHGDNLKWLHTGDLGYVEEDGFVYMTGRIRRIILTTYTEIPAKIFPDEIEKIIQKHSAVESCCVVKVSHFKYGYVSAAYIVLNDKVKYDCEKIEEELRELCHKNLPEYACPFEYRFRQSLPLTTVGKVDWKRLEEESITT